MISICVLVPVLGRPDNAMPLSQSLRASTSERHELVFVCSAFDTEQIRACYETGETVLSVDWEPVHDYPRKMNAAAGLPLACDWLLLGSDDVTFEPGWDIELDRLAVASGKSVIGTNDMANRLVKRGVFSTHALVRRAYVEEVGASLDGPGTLVSEAYEHNFCDRELAALAQARDEWVFASNAIVRHHHPAFGGARQDDIYLKGREHFYADQLLFWERAKGWDYVGLIPQELAVMNRSQRRIARLAATARARRERSA